MYIVRMGGSGLKPRDPMHGAMGSGGHRPAQHKREHARHHRERDRLVRIADEMVVRRRAVERAENEMLAEKAAAEKSAKGRKVHFATPYGSVACGAFSRAGTLETTNDVTKVTCMKCYRKGV